MVERLNYRGTGLLLVDDDGGTWVFCGRKQAFLNAGAAALARRLAAGETVPDSAEARRVAGFLNGLGPPGGFNDEAAPEPASRSEAPAAPAGCSVLVIGAGPAGLSAAATAAAHVPDARHLAPEDAAVVVCDPAPGGLLGLVPSVTLGLMPGMAFRTRALKARLVHAATAAGVVFLPLGVTAVRRARSGRGSSFRVVLEDTSTIRARAVILAVGMTGSLYRSSIHFANVFDDFLPGNLDRRLGAGVSIVLIGRGPEFDLTRTGLAARGYEVRPLGPPSTSQAGRQDPARAWHDFESGCSLTTGGTGAPARLDGIRLAGGGEATGDVFVFDRSYFGPRLPEGFLPARRHRKSDSWQGLWEVLRTGPGGELGEAGLFACGDAAPGVLGVARAIVTGSAAGQSAASFARPGASGLSWAELPLRLTDFRP